MNKFVKKEFSNFEKWTNKCPKNEIMKKNLLKRIFVTINEN